MPTSNLECILAMFHTKVLQNCLAYANQAKNIELIFIVANNFFLVEVRNSNFKVRLESHSTEANGISYHSYKKKLFVTTNKLDWYMLNSFGELLHEKW